MARLHINGVMSSRGRIKLGDYLAAGRAVLASPVGDLVEVFQADQIGVLRNRAGRATQGPRLLQEVA